MFAISFFFSFLTRKIYQKICTIFWQKDKNLGGKYLVRLIEGKVNRRKLFRIFSLVKRKVRKPSCKFKFYIIPNLERFTFNVNSMNSSLNVNFLIL